MHINPNHLPINEKDWIDEVSDNFGIYIGKWINDYQAGILTEDDILNVTKKVAEHKKDLNLFDLIKNRIDNIN